MRSHFRHACVGTGEGIRTLTVCILSAASPSSWTTPAKIFIAVAGLSAALPGVIASITTKPVIGVPVSAKLGGLDALLSIVQMPPGVPVACVGIDNGKNAAHLAKRILDLTK